MTASKIYLDIYIHGHGYPGLRSGKSGLLERHSRVSTPLYYELLWGTVYLQPLR